MGRDNTLRGGIEDGNQVRGGWTDTTGVEALGDGRGAKVGREDNEVKGSWTDTTEVKALGT